jgi:general nucleoside transport system permease protein
LESEKKEYLFLVPLIAVVIGLLVGALFMVFSGNNPVEGYGALFTGIFGTLYDFGETIRQITPLIFTGLSVAFAFRTGLFNIGAEGQYIIGSFVAVVVGIVINLPWFIEAPLAFLAGCVAGGLWSAIAGYLKARFHVHEVISTIMLNYIALIIVNYLIRTYFKAASERTVDIHPSSAISSPWLSDLFDGARIHLGIIIAFLFAYLFYVMLWKTVWGFELRSVGFNHLASEYAGMSVSRNLILSMLISGMLAGAGGASEVLGVYGYLAINPAFPGNGFNGIAVALLGANSPVGILLAAALFGALTYGSDNMQQQAQIPTEVVSIVIAVIILFVASNEAVKRILHRGKKIKGDIG